MSTVLAGEQMSNSSTHEQAIQGSGSGMSNGSGVHLSRCVADVFIRSWVCFIWLGIVLGNHIIFGMFCPPLNRKNRIL